QSLRRLQAITQAVCGALAISDDHDAPGSKPMLRDLRSLAGLRDGMCAAARDNDDAVVAPALRHGDCSLQDRVFLGKFFKDSAARFTCPAPDTVDAHWTSRSISRILSRFRTTYCMSQIG